MTIRPVVDAEPPLHDDVTVPDAGDHDDRQDLPDTGSVVPSEDELQREEAGGFPSALCRALVLDTAVALAKSTEIAARGGRVWTSAVFACAWMSVEDAFEVHRSRFTCKSILGLLRLERDAAPRAVADLSMRNAVLGRIWIQIAQDIAHPLQHRSVMAYDGLFGVPPASGS